MCALHTCLLGPSLLLLRLWRGDAMPCATYSLNNVRDVYVAVLVFAEGWLAAVLELALAATLHPPAAAGQSISFFAVEFSEDFPGQETATCTKSGSDIAANAVRAPSHRPGDACTACSSSCLARTLASHLTNEQPLHDLSLCTMGMPKLLLTQRLRPPLHCRRFW